MFFGKLSRIYPFKWKSSFYWTNYEKELQTRLLDTFTFILSLSISCPLFFIFSISSTILFFNSSSWLMISSYNLLFWSFANLITWNEFADFKWKLPYNLLHSSVFPLTGVPIIEILIGDIPRYFWNSTSNYLMLEHIPFSQCHLNFWSNNREGLILISIFI